MRLRRIYEPAQADDGLRVLVDRLWPRGLKKEQAAVDLWLKEAAPSDELRRWFGHQSERWEEFRRRYRQELEAAPEALSPLLERLRAGEAVTLLYAARDEARNNAVVLREYREEQAAE